MKSLFITAIAFIYVSASTVQSTETKVIPKEKETYKASNDEYKSVVVFQIQIPLPPSEGKRDVEAANKLQSKLTSSFFTAQKKGVVSDENVAQAIGILMPSESNHLDVIELLKVETKVENIRGTDLLELVVKSSDPKFCRDLAKQLIAGHAKSNEMSEGKYVTQIHQEAQLGEPIEEKKQKAEKTGPAQPSPSPKPKSEDPDQPQVEPKESSR
jgi:hypothetical protein